MMHEDWHEQGLVQMLCHVQQLQLDVLQVNTQLGELLGLCSVSREPLRSAVARWRLLAWQPSP